MAWRDYRGNCYQVRKRKGWSEGEEPAWWHEDRARELERQRLIREARRLSKAQTVKPRRPRGAAIVPEQAVAPLEQWADTLRRSQYRHDYCTISELYDYLMWWSERRDGRLLVGRNNDRMLVGRNQLSAWLVSAGNKKSRRNDGVCFVGLLLPRGAFRP
jgi:hypothetical protein